MSQVLFFIAAIGAIAGAVGVVTLNNAFYNVLSLVFHLICLAALFLLLRSEFVAAAQVVVYAGAVMVLYLFVVAYVGSEEQPLKASSATTLRFLGPLVAVSLMVELFVVTLGSGLKALDGRGAEYDPSFGSTEKIGELLLTKFLFPFEVASLLLLVAAIGAVVLARRSLADEVDGTLTVPDDAGSISEGVGRP